VGGRARRRTRTREPFAASAKLTEKVVAAGIAEDLRHPGGVDPARDVVTLGPPFTITEQEIELIGERLELALESALARLR
jgi:adenosylmethionine-8-amino-7-oxononanoate aminotransferase